MATSTAERMEILEGMLHDVMAELRSQREEFSAFREEVRAYIVRQEEHNRQTGVLLKGISTRLGTVEHRVGAIEDRVAALEGNVATEA